MNDSNLVDSFTTADKERFVHADQNKDDYLDREELKALLYPHRHEHMVQHMIDVSLCVLLCTYVTLILCILYCEPLANDYDSYFN